jgi:hypothetical protein
MAGIGLLPGQENYCARADGPAANAEAGARPASVLRKFLFNLMPGLDHKGVIYLMPFSACVHTLLFFLYLCFGKNRDRERERALGR